MKYTAKRLFLIFAIALGLMMGAPMRPDEIEELLHQMNQPKVAHTLRKEDVDDDKLPK